MHVSLMYLPAVGTRGEVTAGTQPGRSTPAYQRMLRNVTAQVRLAERLGFESVVFSEHHFETEGLEVNPNPLLMCLWVGARTKRIRLGTMGCQLPAWNPVRLAEEVAMVDQMLQGRLDLGIVRGQEWPREVVQVGQPYGLQIAAPKSNEERINREIMEEHFSILRTLLTQETVRLKTKHWHLPRDGSAMPDIPVADWVAGVRGRSEAPGGATKPEAADARALPWGYPLRAIDEIGLAPAPYQRPHPPFYIPFVSSPETVRWAAREGIKIVFLEPNIEKFNELAGLYCEAAREAGYQHPLEDSVCAAFWFYVGETEAEVRRVAEPTVHWFNQVYILAIRAKLLGGRDVPWEEFACDNGLGLAVGTPDQVGRRISHFVQETGIRRVYLVACSDLLPHRAMMQAIRLGAGALLPAR